MIRTIQDRLRSFADNNSSEGQDRPAGSHCMRDAADVIDALMDNARIRHNYIMSDTIQDELHALHWDEQREGHGDVCRRAANYIDALERCEVTGDSSEWLTLPWGGVVRKSEVRVVVRTNGDCDNMLGIVIRYTDGTEWEEYAEDRDESAEWLADIERQLGVVR